MMMLRGLCFLLAFTGFAAHAQQCAGGMDASGNQCEDSTTASNAKPAAAAVSAADLQKQINELRGRLSTTTIPMREVGDRFQNIYFAAKGGNWGLAEYMAKRLNRAFDPLNARAPTEAKAWSSFYNGAWQKVGFAIFAKDFKAFEKAYTASMGDCNECHRSAGYGFIEIVHLKSPADPGFNYKKASNPDAVPQ
ncbi:MAG: hypothetical protein ACM3PU_01265 [Gemmatimonadota bacterium]